MVALELVRSKAQTQSQQSREQSVVQSHNLLEDLTEV